MFALEVPNADTGLQVGVECNFSKVKSTIWIKNGNIRSSQKAYELWGRAELTTSMQAVSDSKNKLTMEPVDFATLKATKKQAILITGITLEESCSCHVFSIHSS